MTLTAEEVLAHIRLKKSANINNINNNNNTTTINNEQLNHITTLTTLTTSKNAPLANIHEEEKEFKEPSARLGVLDKKQSIQETLDSRSGIGSPASAKLPAKWRGVKIDLFLNMNKSTRTSKPRLRLVYNIMLIDGTKANLRASMNGRGRDLTRGISPERLTSKHWRRVLKLRAELAELYPDVKSSKFYLTGKKSSVDGAAVFLIENAGTYTSILVLDGEVYSYTLDGDMTDKFSMTNGIATNYFGEEGSSMTMISVKDLGLI